MEFGTEGNMEVMEFDNRGNRGGICSKEYGG